MRNAMGPVWRAVLYVFDLKKEVKTGVQKGGIGLSGVPIFALYISIYRETGSEKDRNEVVNHPPDRFFGGTKRGFLGGFDPIFTPKCAILKV